MKLQCLKNLSINIFEWGQGLYSLLVYSPYIKPYEGSLSGCGQRSETNEAKDHESLNSARGVVEHHTEHFMSPLFKQQGSEIVGGSSVFSG